MQFLNDRAELALGLDTLIEVAEKKPLSSARVRNILYSLQKSLGNPTHDAYQMSFSGNLDELGQWRGYADDGMGCALSTGTASLRPVADVAGWVVYKRREQMAFAYKVLDSLRKSTVDNEISQTLVAAASYIKHDGFSQEQEFRIIKFPEPNKVAFKESRKRLVPYCDILEGHTLPVEKVVVGPGWQLLSAKSEELAKHHVVQSIDRLMEFANMPLKPPILPSRIPYDPR